MPPKVIVAYFDTSVVSDLRTRDKGVTSQDEEKLRKSVDAGRLWIPFSYANVEEIAQAPEDARISEAQLFLKLVNRHRLIRPHQALVTESIRSYARGDKGEVRKFFRKSEQGNIRSDLGALLLGNEWTDRINRAMVVKECKRQKRKFRHTLQDLRSNTRDSALKLRESADLPDFQGYFESRKEKITEHIAERAGFLEACRRRGLLGLLKIPMIRMLVGFTISLEYAQVFEQRRENPGDSRDMWHATLAAATADVFVTHDGDLRDRLARLEVPQLRLASLHELLEIVAT